MLRFGKIGQPKELIIKLLFLAVLAVGSVHTRQLLWGGETVMFPHLGLMI